MSNTVIKVENLSKQYRLGLVGTGTLSHDLNRWWHLIRGKEDPYLKIGEVNNRAEKGNSKYVWALQDINFEVKQGEVLGIIGKNGAGKSTLLKLLSKVTAPSKGKICARGRIASLLEVGTGFHPELTGRENIYLNGTILGMTKHEVNHKLDEIVAFAGIERYLDTPVKRYSSGMTVRLGFAIAAHLEPEILIVDEVLAVGDAEFQKKAIGKMEEVSQKSGRTVLFVSHNMTSIKSFCSRCILLKDGNLSFNGMPNEAVSKYLGGAQPNLNHKKVALSHPEIEIQLVGIREKNKSYSHPLSMDSSIEIIIECVRKLSSNDRLDITLQFKDEEGKVVFPSSSAIWLKEVQNDFYTVGKLKFCCKIPPNFFNQGVFEMNLLIIRNQKVLIAKYESILSFTILPKEASYGSWMGRVRGVLLPKLDWVYKKSDS